MIRQMIKGQTNSRRDGEENQQQKLVDRSIHSSEEGFQETTVSTDYSVQAIPPFRGNGNGRGAVDIMDDSSSHSNSSLGAQSNFIQRRINMHREKGEWSKVTNAAVSSDDDDDDDYHNEVAKDSASSVSTRNNTDAAGQSTNECSDINNKPNTELARTSSIVSFLKMEPICEKKQLRNTIDYEDETNNNNKSSFKSDVSGISDHDEGYEIGDMDMATQDENETNNEEDVLPRRSSFLPNVNIPDDDAKRYVEVEIKSMVDVNKGDYAYNGTNHSGGDDSDTFGFASIHSTDNMTHASDAPDYDYNSEHGKEDKSDTKERIPSIRAGHHTQKNAEVPHMQKFIPPMERRRVSQQRQAHATGKDTVCEVLGLPKDKPRKVHRGIMSADTEIRLRDLMGGEESSSVNHINSSASKLEPNDPPSVGSDDSSIDLAFGDSPERPAKEEDRWERMRIERQTRRASTSSTTTSANTNGTSSARKLETKNDKEESSWHNSFNWIKSPLRTVYNNDEDDNTTVGQTSTGATMIGKLYSRFQRPSQSDDDESSESSSDSDDSSSSDDSSDDGETWHENILTEGQYYLSMSMLVYVYGLLRETSLLGHTEITFDEVDVNSSQSESRMGKSHRYLNNTKSAGFIIRVVMDELEKKGAFSSIEKEGDMSVLREFKQWVHDSRCNQLDSATSDTIRELRRQVARKRWKRAINAVRLAVRLGNRSSKVNLLVAQQSFRRNKRSSMDLLKENMTDSLQNLKSVGARAARGSRDLAKSMMWMHNQKSQIMDGLGYSEEEEANQNTLVDQSDIREIVNDALEQPRFFKEGSLMSNLIESSIEVVWFSDRHPNDVVYSICCCRRQKRVSVVFRGTVNSHNWQMNMKFFMTKHPNPIMEDYPGREETLGLHTGYSLYMTRQRKDDSLTKIEEIFSKIDTVGREIAPDGDYELSITGHSLGGGLATILSFFAATNQAFSRVKTIRVFTYAAPRVGCYGFARAFQHLERKGKLRLARFSNTRDLVPLIPIHGMDRMGRSYRHVGMHIRLLGISKISQYWLRQALDVTYPKDDSWWPLLKRSFWANFLVNLNTSAGMKRTHHLSEHQKRIRFTLEFRSALAQTDLRHDKKRARLKTLDEYYFIKGGTSLTGTKELTKELTEITIEEKAKLADKRRLKKIVFGLLIIAIAEAILLLRFMDVTIQCSSIPLILYPLYPLSGCQHQGKDSSTKMKEVKVLASQSEVPTKRSPLLSWRWPSALSLRRRRVLFPALSASPCFWGHCYVTPKSRLPWGIRFEHHTMPTDFEYELDHELVVLLEEQLIQDAHLFVLENAEIQSNISNAAFTKLKAAENSLQKVEFETGSHSVLKDVVRFAIDLLERMII